MTIKNMTFTIKTSILMILLLSANPIQAGNPLTDTGNAVSTETVGGMDEVKMPRKPLRTVYYVVIGSYSSVEEARKARYYMPDAIDASPLFRATSKGKVVYRMCTGIYYSKAKAQAEVRDLKKYMSIDAWIWANKGQAYCADRPIGNNEEPANITPQ